MRSVIRQKKKNRKRNERQTKIKYGSERKFVSKYLPCGDFLRFFSFNCFAYTSETLLIGTWEKISDSDQIRISERLRE